MGWAANDAFGASGKNVFGVKRKERVVRKRGMVGRWSGSRSGPWLGDRRVNSAHALDQFHVSLSLNFGNTLVLAIDDVGECVEAQS